MTNRADRRTRGFLTFMAVMGFLVTSAHAHDYIEKEVTVEELREIKAK